MAKVSAKVRKASMYKMISYKGVTGVQSKYTPLTAAQRLPTVERSVGAGLKSIVNGINSLGSTLNSIAANTQNTVESWRDNIRSQVKSADKIQKQEALTDKKDRKRKLNKDKLTEKRRKFQLRNNKEDKAEKAKSKKEGIISGAIGAAKKTGGGLFAAIFGLFGLLMDAIKFKIFEWIAKNPKAVTKLGLTLAAIGKFIFNIISFLGGMSLDGLVSFLENPISLKGFFGIIKFLTGAVPIFAGFVLLKNPKLLLDGAKKVIGGIVGGLRKLFGFQSKDQKFREYKLKKARGGKGNFFSTRGGKIATGLGAGAAGFMAAKGDGATNVEAAATGVGAAGGQAVGAKLGDMAGKALGIPGMGAIGGAIGGMAGGKIGDAVGGLIQPIVEPVSRFFKMIGDTFGTVIADIKKPMEEFFTTLGTFLSGILDAVEPHMPIISKIIGIGFKVLFWPLFLGMKALTAVLKLFTGGDTKELKGDGGGGTKSEERYTKYGGERYEPGEKMSPRQRVAIQLGMKMGNDYPAGVMEDFNKSGGAVSPEEAKAAGMTAKDVKDGGFAKGGLFAKGGWISGPQSGYPVSLDGKSTSFIGHGTEWVGSKMAAGGAFVVPFDTPATRSDKGLTGRRLKQAKRGGYALPAGFAKGGKVIKATKPPQPPVPKKQAIQKPKNDKPKGIMRWLAGAADQATGGFFDFDKQGHSIYQASGMLQKAGQVIDDAKQRFQQQKFEKLQNALQDSASTVVVDDAAPGQMTGSDMSQDNPIIIPGNDHHDADKYIQPKYGIIAEFMTDPVEFM